MTLHVLLVALAGTLLVYHQVTTWVPLFPWNDVARYTRKELLLEAGINGLLMGTAVVCLALGNSGFCRYFPLIYFPFLFVGECVDWWIPFVSPSFAKKRKIWDYEAHFARTFKLIPHTSGRRTPDANHIVLHALTVVTVVMVYAEFLS